MDWKIIRNIDNDYLKVKLSASEEYSSVIFLFTGIKKEYYPEFISGAANEKGYSYDMGGVLFYGDLDEWDRAHGNDLSSEEVEVYHYSFGENRISKSEFWNILNAFSSELLDVYKDNAELISTGWIEEMRQAINNLRSKIADGKGHERIKQDTYTLSSKQAGTISDITLIDDKGKKRLLQPKVNDRYYTERSEDFTGVVLSVQWKSKGKEVMVNLENQEIKAYPSPDFRYMIILIRAQSINGRYPAQNKAFVYDEDGKMVRELNMPTLTSGIAAKYAKEPFGFFREVYWAPDKNGKVSAAITIDFNWDWYERRILDPETGVFGEVIMDGMY